MLKGPMLKYTLFSLAILSSFSHAAIFGVDSRENITPGSKWDELARSTAISVIVTTIQNNGNGTYKVETGKQSDLCPEERFRNEPIISMSCSGFLVGPDLLATAGHCMYAINRPNEEIENEEEFTCKVFDWVFDYQVKNDGKVNSTKILAKDIYHCKKIVFAAQHSKKPFSDFALIQLDRPVVGRKPLPIAKIPPALGDVLHMIGHPFGTPTKISTGGRVILNNPVRSTFITTLDAFGGNSGSAVFNNRNELVGILAAGTPSQNTYTDEIRQCELVNRCDDNAKNCKHPDADPSVFPEFQAVGSEVQRIDALSKFLR